MSLVSHGFALLIGLNIGALIGWVIANTDVRTGEEVARVSETPDEDPRGGER
jgi:hypothetical protein